jgi:hypothetical protein
MSKPVVIHLLHKSETGAIESVGFTGVVPQVASAPKKLIERAMEGIQTSGITVWAAACDSEMTLVELTEKGEQATGETMAVTCPDCLCSQEFAEVSVKQHRRAYPDAIVKRIKIVHPEQAEAIFDNINTVHAAVVAAEATAKAERKAAKLAKAEVKPKSPDAIV